MNNNGKPNSIKMFSGKRSYKFQCNSIKRSKYTRSTEKYVDASSLKRKRILMYIFLTILLSSFLVYIYSKSQSSYDIWRSLGNSGTAVDFIDSLKGDQGEQGIKGEQGGRGPQGDSAFEIWKNSNLSNSSKTEDEFIKTLKGDTGEKGDSSYEAWRNSSTQNKYKSEAEYIRDLKGDQGEQGDSAYEIWKKADINNADKTEGDFFNDLKGVQGEKGDSSYEIWKKLDIENSNKSAKDFINSLKGEKGDQGDSAFVVWRDSDPANSDKTEADFIASLKGDKGDIGGAGGFKAGELRIFPTKMDGLNNWLLCDGSKYDISKYPDLYKALESDTTPDLRNRIVAMFDDDNAIRTTAGKNDDVFLTKENLPTYEYNIAIAHDHDVQFKILENGAHSHELNVMKKDGANTEQAFLQWKTAGPNSGHYPSTTTNGNHSHSITAITTTQDNTKSKINLNSLTQQGLNLKQPTVTAYYYIYVGNTN